MPRRKPTRSRQPSLDIYSLDLSKLKLVEQNDYTWIRHSVYEIERVEMPVKVKVVRLIVTEENGLSWLNRGGVAGPWKESRRYKSTSIKKKYFCIGGPIDGKFATTTDAGSDYAFYIRHVGGRKQKIPSGVLICKSWLGVRCGLEW